MTTTTPARRYVVGTQTIEAPKMAGGLYLVATPIGNLGDISLRALACLAGVDLILCEDTRNTSRLLERYSIRTPKSPYHDHNGAKVRPHILEKLERGASIALVSDAGTPLVNDPGFKLVRDAISADIRIEMMPGASAPIMALALSGLPTDRFLFSGYLSPKAKARLDMIQSLSAVPATLIFFETATRLVSSLDDFEKIMPNRKMAIARELTKIHEEIIRGIPSELKKILEQRNGIKGEITLIVEPPTVNKTSLNEEEIKSEMKDLLVNFSVKEAASKMSITTGKSRKDLYALAISLKEEIDQ